MTNEIQELFNLQMDALKEIGNVGAGNAATSLSVMIRRPVNLKVPQVNIVSGDGIREAISEDVSGIHISVHGDVPCNILFILPRESAGIMVDILMGLPEGTTRVFNEMEQSALKEVGNILAGTYLSALNQFTGLRFELTAPELSENIIETILGHAWFDPFLSGKEYALIIETELTERDNRIIGDIILLPSPGTLNTIFDRLGVTRLLQTNTQ